MILKIKNSVKKYIVKFLTKYISKLGFINYYIYHIDGPTDRLIINGTYNEEQPFVNTIFNTGSGNITLGDGVIFGHNCMLLTGKHNYESKDIDILRNDVPQGRNIVIGDGCWIASGAIIMGNVTIGKHCVIAAGSIVTRDIPEYSFVAGVPGKIVKKI
jgi:acetyltransferase-like isoleucine patch superfamily enzyme